MPKDKEPKEQPEKKQGGLLEGWVNLAKANPVTFVIGGVILLAAVVGCIVAAVS